MFFYSSPVPPLTHSRSPLLSLLPIRSFSPFVLLSLLPTKSTACNLALLNLIKHRRAEGCGKFAVQWPVIRSKVTARLGGDLQQINGENLLLQQVCDVSMWAMRCVIHSATDAFSLAFYTLHVQSAYTASCECTCVRVAICMGLHMYTSVVHHPFLIKT
jgi:hypothetical protein